jgi:uncharacterized membrane protein
MNRQTMMAAAFAAAMMTMTVSLFAAEQPAATAAKSEPIYGYRMMNDQERNDYRERMRNAGSAQERQAVRDEHRKVMEARAKERGVTLPERRGPGAGMSPGGEARGPAAGRGPRWEGQGGPGFGKGKGYGPGGKPGLGKGPGKGQGYGPGAGKGPGPRGDCPAGQECPGPGKGPGPRQQQ